MDRSGPPPAVEMLFFGNDAERLVVRADFQPERRRELAPGSEFRLDFGPGRPAATCRWTGGERLEASNCQVAFDHVLEVAVPLAALGLAPGDDCAFRAELVLAGAGAGVGVERHPAEGEIRFALSVPEP
jgi:hypothetical protein